MELFFLILVLAVMAVTAFASLALMFVMLRIFVRGIARLRFSLRSMMLTVIGGAACGTLLANWQYPAVFALGLACTTTYVAFLWSEILRLGTAVEPMPQIPQAENRGTV